MTDETPEPASPDAEAAGLSSSGRAGWLVAVALVCGVPGLMLGLVGWSAPSRTLYVAGAAGVAIAVGCVIGWVTDRRTRAWIAILAGLLAAALVATASIATPPVLVGRMSSKPLWQTSTGGEVQGVIVVRHRVYVLDDFAIRAFEASTGAVIFSVPAKDTMDLSVGADGSFVGYRPASHHGHDSNQATYYDSRGHKRWTVSVRDDNDPNPTVAIGDGYVVLHDWQDRHQGDSSGINRGIAPDGHQAWSRPVPAYQGGVALEAAATTGQPGQWDSQHVRRAPSVDVLGNNASGPVTVLSPSGTTIDRTTGAVLGIRDDLVVLQTGSNSPADCRISGRQAGRQRWRSQPLSPCAHKPYAHTTPDTLYWQTDQEHPNERAVYSIDLTNGASNNLQAALPGLGAPGISLDAHTLIPSKPADGRIEAVDAATGNRRWSTELPGDGQSFAEINNGTVTADIDVKDSRLIALGGGPTEADQILTFDARTGRRTGTLLAGHAHSWGLSIPPMESSYGLGNGRGLIVTRTGELIALGSA